MGWAGWTQTSKKNEVGILWQYGPFDNVELSRFNPNFSNFFWVEPAHTRILEIVLATRTLWNKNWLSRLNPNLFPKIYWKSCTGLTWIFAWNSRRTRSPRFVEYGQRKMRHHKTTRQKTNWQYPTQRICSNFLFVPDIDLEPVWRDVEHCGVYGISLKIDELSPHEVGPPPFPSAKSETALYRMVQTPGAGTGDSVGRCRRGCDHWSTLINYNSNLRSTITATSEPTTPLPSPQYGKVEASKIRSTFCWLKFSDFPYLVAPDEESENLSQSYLVAPD